GGGDMEIDVGAELLSFRYHVKLFEQQVGDDQIEGALTRREEELRRLSRWRDQCGDEDAGVKNRLRHASPRAQLATRSRPAPGPQLRRPARPWPRSRPDRRVRDHGAGTPRSPQNPVFRFARP